MKKYFTRFLALVCCLAASLTASAQYSKVFETYPAGYTPMLDATFELSAVAETLGTDATTLATALNGTWSTPLFFLEDADGNRYSDYTQGSNGGFWMTAQATPTGWTGEVGEDVWYNVLAVDEETNAFTISIGQHPDALQGGEELKAKFVLAFNEKEATFDITMKILTIDIPTEPVLLSKLNVIQHKSVEVHQWARSSDYGEADTLDFKGIPAALGISPELFAVGLQRVVFATKVREDDGLGLMGDTLTNVPTATAPGWWFDTTNDTPIYSKFVAKSDGVFFVDGFQFNPETEQLIFNIGQKGGALPIDGSDQGIDDINEVGTTIYFVYDGKAIDLKVKLVIDEREKVPFAEMTEVGSEDVNLSQYPTSSYESSSFSVDIDAVAALLEVDPTEITLWAPISEDEISDEPSAGNQGFWFNMDGYRASWGAGCGIFVENPTAGDYSTFNVGQYPNAFEGGQTGVATLYFVAGSKYYTVHVSMEILTKEGPGVEFQSVAQRAVKIQIVPASTYPVDMRYEIDPAELQALIDTTTPTLYAQKAPAEGTEWVDGEYSDAYSCDPKPGFWMSKEGFASTWGSSPWGFSYLSEGSSDLSRDGIHEFEFFQMPNQNQVGDEYNAVIYLVNEQTGKMITYNFNVRFVSSVVPQAEVVGTTSVTLPVKKNSEANAVIDVTEALEKIGLTDADQLFGVPTLAMLTADGTMTDVANLNGGWWLLEDGSLDTTSGDQAVLGVTFAKNSEKEVVATIYELNGTWTTESKINSRFGLQYEGKIYLFNVTFVAEEVVGIREAKGTSAAQSIFDLSGRRVEKAQRGVYIQGGKKVIVK